MSSNQDAYIERFNLTFHKAIPAIMTYMNEAARQPLPPTGVIPLRRSRIEALTLLPCCRTPRKPP